MRAVWVDEPGKGEIVELPSGVLLDILGPAAVPGFVEIRTRDELYSVFHEDLVDRSVKVLDAAV